MFIAHTELLLQIIDVQWVILNAEKHLYEVKSALSEGVKKFILNFLS